MFRFATFQEKTESFKICETVQQLSTVVILGRLPQYCAQFCITIGHG